jgi:hypothetical protein
MDKANLGNDVASINALVGFLNGPALTSAAEGASAGETNPAVALASTTPDASEQAAQANANPLIHQKTPVAVMPVNDNPAVVAPMRFDKIFLTGRLCAGKDYLASKIGAEVEGFSRPLYALAEFFFGVRVTADSNKDIPGMRAFLQAVGQWGRGTVSAAYPLTPARAIFITAIRSLAAAGQFDKSLGVDWDSFGRSDNIWLDAALLRVSMSNAARHAITGCRYSNEFKRLTEEGWINWHVMTTPNEWHARLAKRNIKPDAPVLKDISEQLAANLDNQVIAEISKRKIGPKLRVVWSSATPPPSSRLWTVAEFLRAANVPYAPATRDDIVLTGE